MGILKSLFKSTPPPEGPTWEIVEKRLSIDDQRYKVRVKKGGREFYAEDFFQAALKTGNLRFNRFFLLNEKPPKPYFALFTGGGGLVHRPGTTQRRV
jgi:hypothetical protein